MKSVVLEKKGSITLRDFPIEEKLGSKDVRIAIDTVGICGSDVHYYEYGRIGPYVVQQPMILGHEASGEVTEVGSEVTSLSIGDRVCMEPGIPNMQSKASMQGMYNLDPDVRFWATPPIHGCLRESVVHPEFLTFKLPPSVSFAEGAMVEPLAVGLQAVKKASPTAGDVAVVIGAGTIGLVTAMAAISGGCSRVIISDIVPEKLEIAATLPGITAVNVSETELSSRVQELTGGWGGDLLFEASGNPKVYATLFDSLAPGAAAVLVGMPVSPVQIDIVAAQAKEIRIESVFRYANVYPRALDLMESGKIDVTPLITDTFTMEDAPRAFDYVRRGNPKTIKAQIKVR